MSDLTIQVDATDVLAMLDRLDDVAASALKAVAKETAQRIQAEARARLDRQTTGSGQTAEAIAIDEIAGGYRVFVGPMGNRPANLPYWLEKGTQKMTARPFMFAAARLEEGRHLRRVREALIEACAEVGNG